MRWPWSHHRSNGAARARAEAEARLRASERLTPVYERMAPHLARLPAEEFAERIARAFRWRP
jgi:hypothetical protein